MHIQSNIRTCEFGERCPDRDKLCNLTHAPDCAYFLEGLCGYWDPHEFPHTIPNFSLFHPSPKTTSEEQDTNKNLRHKANIANKKIDKLEKLVENLRAEIPTIQEIKDDIKKNLNDKLIDDTSRKRPKKRSKET